MNKSALQHYREYLGAVESMAKSLGFELYFHEDLGYRLDPVGDCPDESHELGHDLDVVGAFLKGYAAASQASEDELPDGYLERFYQKHLEECFAGSEPTAEVVMDRYREKARIVGFAYTDEVESQLYEMVHAGLS